jgi:hypothetical protein
MILVPEGVIDGPPPATSNSVPIINNQIPPSTSSDQRISETQTLQSSDLLDTVSEGTTPRPGDDLIDEWMRGVSGQTGELPRYIRPKRWLSEL